MSPTPLPASIRAMTLEDLQAVLEIDRLSFALPWPESSYRFELAGNPAAHLLVAELAQEDHRAIVGYVGYWLIVDEAHISTIAVHPARRGHGLGERLMIEALNAAGLQGAEMATLEVRASNEPAINMYRKLGFQIVGRREAYYRDNDEDALLMTLNALPGAIERPPEDVG